MDLKIVTIVALSACVGPGCAPGSMEETEDTDEVGEGLDGRDGAPGGWTADDACMASCHRASMGCYNECGTRKGEAQPECHGLCTAAYHDCIRSCGYGRGGCQSLYDCHPWWIVQ